MYHAIVQNGVGGASGRVGQPRNLATVVDAMSRAIRSAVDAEVVLWGEDAELAKWLAKSGIRLRHFSGEPQAAREVLLVSYNAAAPGGTKAFGELARRLARGSTAVFLSPSVFAHGNDSTALLPLPRKGSFAPLPSAVAVVTRGDGGYSAFGR